MLFGGSLILVTACGDTQSGKKHSAQDTPADTSGAVVIHPVAVRVDPALAAHVQAIYHAYLQIQQALADDQPDAAAGAAAAFSRLSVGFNADAGQEFYNSQCLALNESAKAIAGTKDIKEQRTSFESLSTIVFGLLKFYGNDKPVYQAHCPMAFEDKGAAWLSDKAVVQNPYYGEDMRECGEIVAVIRQ